MTTNELLTSLLYKVSPFIEKTFGIDILDTFKFLQNGDKQYSKSNKGSGSNRNNRNNSSNDGNNSNNSNRGSGGWLTGTAVGGTSKNKNKKSRKKKS